MNKMEIMARIELNLDKVFSVSKAIEDACPVYTADERTSEKLEQLMALVSVLQDQVSILRSSVDALEA